MIAKDIAGQRFGRLVAIRRVENLPPYKQARWLFKCDCGKEHTQFGYVVWHGNNKSCGCLRKDTPAHLIHGGTGTPEYRAWASMRGRCLCPTNRAYALYGGRGIKICARWRSFDNFLADMGPRPTAKHSIDRVNTNGNYSPSNCRWATKSEQVRNRRLSIIYMGRPLKDWCESLGLPYQTIWHRYNIGERDNLLFRPVRSR